MNAKQPDIHTQKTANDTTWPGISFPFVVKLL